MRLFIIGNGFDRAHDLPTEFDKDFKKIAKKYEINNFWEEIYQTHNKKIWSDFENSLAHPDFNTLEEIFNGYEPDYCSDKESDRNAIITQVDLNGNLYRSLYEFANTAERQLVNTNPLSKFESEFSVNDIFITFNYTHTLEKLYNIEKSRILHIHGEVGQNNLILGYPEKDYSPEKYYFDVRGKGNCPFREIDYQEYIEVQYRDGILDYYTYSASCDLIEKTRSFSKKTQENAFNNFINNFNVQEIIIIGHSCKIDFDYYQLLLKHFPQTKWNFIYHDPETKINMEGMISRFEIINYELIEDSKYLRKYKQ